VDVDTQNTDPYIPPNYLKIPVDPPYLKPTEKPLNELGLQKRDYYTTQDLCKVLNLHPDTFRYRLRVGHYPEPERVGGKRRFSEQDIREIVQITKTISG